MKNFLEFFSWKFFFGIFLFWYIFMIYNIIYIWYIIYPIKRSPRRSISSTSYLQIESENIPRTPILIRNTENLQCRDVEYLTKTGFSSVSCSTIYRLSYKNYRKDRYRSFECITSPGFSAFDQGKRSSIIFCNLLYHVRLG